MNKIKITEQSSFELVFKDLTKEIGKLQYSLQLMVKKVQKLEKDNETLMKIHIVKVEDEPKPKKVTTKTIKPRKKATKKEVK